MRKITLEECEVVRAVEDDDALPEDCFDVDAEEQAKGIRDSYNAGNPFAWCHVTIKVRWTSADGTVFEGRDALGGMSCENEKQLDEEIEHHGMQETALEDLNDQILRYVRIADALREELRDG